MSTPSPERSAVAALSADDDVGHVMLVRALGACARDKDGMNTAQFVQPWTRVVALTREALSPSMIVGHGRWCLLPDGTRAWLRSPDLMRSDA